MKPSARLGLHARLCPCAVGQGGTSYALECQESECVPAVGNKISQVTAALCRSSAKICHFNMVEGEFASVKWLR